MLSMLSTAPIATMLWHNEEFASGLGADIVLDAVVCVVDAVFGRQVSSKRRKPVSLADPPLCCSK